MAFGRSPACETAGDQAPGPLTVKHADIPTPCLGGGRERDKFGAAAGRSARRRFKSWLPADDVLLAIGELEADAWRFGISRLRVAAIGKNNIRVYEKACASFGMRLHGVLQS